ncbi:MAG: hypothetical protein K2I66_06565 [Bacteroidales bacterium]|nr:hypothetical protein [Bacteroidales bacterium]
MNLALNTNIAQQYKSKSQKYRVITETWLGDNMYCPICGEIKITHYKANKPVADFCCKNCNSDFELKSKESKHPIFTNIIPDGAYHTMIERITSLHNPNLFVMTHFNQSVNNLILIPKFFFVPSTIIKRPPLKEGARREGWIGCNINLENIPNEAKIPIINDGVIMPSISVKEHYKKLLSLKTDVLQNRGWLIDTMACIDKLKKEEFTLQDIYMFENLLKKEYPNNNFIKAKLRQQLQILRDKGFIEFTTRGHYKKLRP